VIEASDESRLFQVWEVWHELQFLLEVAFMWIGMASCAGREWNAGRTAQAIAPGVCTSGMACSGVLL